MKFDPHIHSVYSGDSRSEVIDILIQAEKKGLDAIAISDHNEIAGSRLARSYGGSIIVVPSIEISSDKGHILGFSYYRHGLFCNVDKNLGVDGVETKNARYIFGYSNKQAETLAYNKRLATLGASDSHFLKSVGDAFTEVNTKGNDSVDGILKAIKHRRCKAMGHRTSNFLIAKEVFVKKVLRRYPKREE